MEYCGLDFSILQRLFQYSSVQRIGLKKKKSEILHSGSTVLLAKRKQKRRNNIYIQYSMYSFFYLTH